MRKLNVTILVGVIVAIIGFALVFAYGSNVDKRVADGKRTHKVLVSTALLRQGATPAQITASTVSKDVPEAYLAEGYLTNLDSVKGLVLLGPVGQDSQLTATMFGQPLDAGAVTPSKGNVALAVQVELSPGVARYIVPGSSIDVFVTYTGGAGGQSASSGRVASRTKLFLSKVTVLSVSIATPPAGKDQAKTDGSTATATSSALVVAVVDVSPTDAEKLVNATTLGSIYFALSSVDGKGVTHTTPTGVTPDDVVVSNR